MFFAEKRTSEWSQRGDVFSELRLAALGWVRTEKSEAWVYGFGGSTCIVSLSTLRPRPFLKVVFRQITAGLTRVHFIQNNPKFSSNTWTFACFFFFFFSGLKEQLAHVHIYTLISLVMPLEHWKYKDCFTNIYGFWYVQEW